MSSNPVTRSHVQLTVKTTAAIINLVVILILDEVYGAVARWLTVLGKFFMGACVNVAPLKGENVNKGAQTRCFFFSSFIENVFFFF